MNTDPVMLNLKLSEITRLTTNERRLVKITGKIDMLSEKTIGKEVLVFSEESISDTNERSEVIIDTELLEDFNLADINSQHDIVQFIGYKDLNTANCEPGQCRFKAMNFRIISRTSLTSYYFAIDTQNAYINRKKLISN